MIITLSFNLESLVPASFLNFGRKIENSYYNHIHLDTKKNKTRKLQGFLRQLCMFRVY